jgi:DNA-binding transcriptional MerR regulator
VANHIHINSPKLYSISQVHALTGVPKPTLRFWEKEFKEYIEPERTSGNQRRYNEKTIENIQKINYLVKVEGYTLDGARKKLEVLEGN